MALVGGVMAEQARLVDRSVGEFVAAVASAAEPVPAGGSVSALTGAASAALLVLVCGVLDRKRVDGVEVLLDRAAEVQRRLLALIDEDANAYGAYLVAMRAHDGAALGQS
ncbi:MAG TPA: cyclodeaminase/cyclohydrolase family protein, partial [Chloroflexota bacterium]|nr:cyclodeaminase/cyclohydrolase family protein [Chloroflexota bacterium]